MLESDFARLPDVVQLGTGEALLIARVMRTKKVAVVITKDLAVALPQGLPVEALPGGDYEVVALDEISGVPADVMEA